MRHAELNITLGGWHQVCTTHRIIFETVEQATAEFERISALLKKRADKGNDVPRFLDVDGVNRFTCEFDQINAVGLVDLFKANESERGIRDEYPHLYRRAD